jgi:hypothetical protein
MQQLNVQFQNLNPWILLIFGISMGILFFILHKSDRVAERWQRVLLLIRFLIFLLILIIIIKPIVKWTSVRQLNPQIKVFVDQSASMLKHDNVSRDSIITLVDQVQSEFQKRGFEVAIYPFSGELADNPVSIKNLQFNQNGTDLSKVLSKGIHQSGSNVSAGILITDGVFTQGEDPMLMDIQSDFPVYPIGIGDSIPAFDPAVLDLMIPAIVTAGDTVTVEARVLPLGHSETIQVFLDEGKQRIQTKKIKTTSQNLYQAVKFDIVMDKPGIFRYSVMVDTTQDKNPCNNLRSASIRVKPNRTTVVLIQGQASFEARYFNRLLQSIPGLKVISLLETQAGWYAVEAGNLLLVKWDAVALFGFPTANTSSKILSSVQAKIAQDRPAIYVQYMKGLDFDRLERLLDEQVFLSHVIDQNNRSIAVQVAEEQRSHPIIRDLSSDLAYKSGWSELPPIGMPFRNLVLADYLKGLISSMGNQSLPVLAVGSIRRSRMAVVTGIDLWRWDMMTVESENHALFSDLEKNLIKWLTDTLSTANLQLSLNKEIYLTGEVVELKGIVSDVQGNLLKNAVINAQLVDKGNNSLPFLIQWDGFQYSGFVPMQAEGEYKIEAAAFVNNNPVGNFQQKVAVLENSIESQSLRLNVEALRSIALKTGGKYYPGNGIKSMDNSVLFNKVKLEQYHELKLWRWSGIFIILILLLFTEWTIRRIVGYQ